MSSAATQTTASATVPATDLGGLPPIERQIYRDGMARVPAAVNIITSSGENGWCGFTASAVTSVTDSPPTLLVCINRTAQAHSSIVDAGILCVNTVSAEQEELAMVFAGAGGIKDMTTRFAGGSWTELVTGAPALTGAIVSFDCRVVSVSAVGTHDVFFCEVVAAGGGDAVDSKALVYFDRKFHALA